MNSENTLDNISKLEKLRNILIEKKKVLLFITGVFLLFVGITIAILVMRHNKIENLRKQYLTFCDEYNETVESFNIMATKYNELVNAEMQSADISNLEAVELLNIFEEDFEQFYDSGADQSKLHEELDEISQSLIEVTNSYNELCLSSYNTAIDDYNTFVEKYNLLLDKLSVYGIANMPNKEKTKATVADNYCTYYERWGNVETFKNELKSIQKDKEMVDGKYYEVCLLAYDSVINDYYIVAEAYTDILEKTSVHFIEGMLQNVELRERHSNEEVLGLGEEELCLLLEEVLIETDTLIGNYLVVEQITAPAEEWVLERLEEVDSVTGMQAVTSENDPNGLLGKEGGYISCIYFITKDISPTSVKGSSIVEKGTDAGGAIEVYDTLEYALNRCDYLSQFDGTLLYSGSYAIIGTMVVRTSYKLSNSEQVALTNEITKVMTMIK